MAISPSDLRAIPLFQDFTDEHMQALMDAFERRELPAGEVLFEAGTRATDLLLLVRGKVSLHEGNDVRFRLHPIAPIGELGAVTDLPRATTAITTEPSQVWIISKHRLMRFFEAHGEVAFPFYRNLLHIVANKVRRDTRRLDEMRVNIVRTQKAMKRMRDLVLQAEDTSISKTVYETLEDLIEHNRRWHYLVEPAHTLRAAVRLDDGATTDVIEMSAGWIKLRADDTKTPEVGKHWSAVLVLPSGEIPVSGTVEAAGLAEVLVKLDLLIADYAAKFEDYLTRLHMLDFVV
jgi:CRP-like cAMP-binding protein